MILGKFGEANPNVTEASMHTLSVWGPESHISLGNTT